MKILAIASAGGHWTQLLRLRESWTDHKVIFVSTKPSFGKLTNGDEYISIRDSSRWDKVGLIVTFKQIFLLMYNENPDFVITTGAAPGLMAIIVARLLGKRSIWVDSIANVEKISLSGKIASYFTPHCYTQWLELKNKSFKYAGNILK